MLGPTTERTPGDGTAPQPDRAAGQVSEVPLRRPLLGYVPSSGPRLMHGVLRRQRRCGRHAVLTVVVFPVGIARAWQLIGARETGLFHVVGTVIRDRAMPSAGEAVGAPTGRRGDGPEVERDARD